MSSLKGVTAQISTTDNVSNGTTMPGKGAIHQFKIVARKGAPPCVGRNQSSTGWYRQYLGTYR